MASVTHPIQEMSDAIGAFLEKIEGVVRSWPNEPKESSVAASELSEIDKYVSMALSHASLSIEDGADHLSGLVKLAAEPVSTIACFTCIRSMLESCAIGAWLVDPSVNASRRRARVYAFNRSGMDEYRKFLGAVGQSTEAANVKAKIQQLEAEATSVGLTLDSEPDSKSGCGICMPSATAIIRDVLALDKNYRLLSGLAHGHNWARRIFYKERSKGHVAGASGSFMEKTLPVEAFMLACHSGFVSQCRVLWNLACYTGNNQLSLEEMIDDAADRIQVKVEDRFWRTES